MGTKTFFERTKSTIAQKYKKSKLLPRPSLQLVISRLSADPFPAFGIEEERHAAAEILVEFGELGGILFVVPGFEALDGNSRVLFELVDERHHGVAMRTFLSVEVH